jgi:F0F1-type ATP synthase assembly protein I
VARVALDRDRARIIAWVQCAATVASVALFALLDEAWYARVLPGLLVVLIANIVIRGWMRRRGPGADE